jgi:hypothetical protein
MRKHRTELDPRQTEAHSLCTAKEMRQKRRPRDEQASTGTHKRGGHTGALSEFDQTLEHSELHGLGQTVGHMVITLVSVIRELLASHIVENVAARPCPLILQLPAHHDSQTQRIAIM